MEWDKYLKSWATPYLEKLELGETVVCNPKGSSMEPKIHSGDSCTIVPIGNHRLDKDDIVLCKVKGAIYLHLIKAVREGQYQIGNNRGRINGWVSRNAIYGLCTKVESP